MEVFGLLTTALRTILQGYQGPTAGGQRAFNQFFSNYNQPPTVPNQVPFVKKGTILLSEAKGNLEDHLA